MQISNIRGADRARRSRRPPSPRSSAAGPASADTPTSPPPVTVLTHGNVGKGDFFVSPFSDQSTYANGPEILDPNGNVVWFKPLPQGQEATDFRTQTYKGKPVLTWWQGTGLGGLAKGVDYIYNDHYQQIATVQAGNGLSADGHEFLITPWNTALILAYTTAQADLTSIGGPANQTVIDGVVQEIDIKTGKVLFQWNSADHVPYSQSQQPLPASPSTPWDWFHVNAVKLDTDGNLLIDARDTWTSYKVDRHSGKIIWQLGGKASANNFNIAAAPGQVLNEAGADHRLAARFRGTGQQRLHLLRQRVGGCGQHRGRRDGRVRPQSRRDREDRSAHAHRDADQVVRPARGPHRPLAGQPAAHRERQLRRRLGLTALLLGVRPRRNPALRRPVPGRRQQLPRLPAPLEPGKSTTGATAPGTTPAARATTPATTNPEVDGPKTAI